MTPVSPTDDLLDPFDCPRCGSTVAERFWGPCTACRTQMTEAYDRAGTGAAEAAPTRFEPSMHVVPNHVATKD